MAGKSENLCVTPRADFSFLITERVLKSALRIRDGNKPDCLRRTSDGETIISPWVFYLIDISEGLKFLFIAIGIVSLAIGLFVCMTIFDDSRISRLVFVFKKDDCSSSYHNVSWYCFTE